MENTEKKAPKLLDVAGHIGHEAFWLVDVRGAYQVKIKVMIKNVEIIYGHACYTIEPLAGEGQARVHGGGLQIL